MALLSRIHGALLQLFKRDWAPPPKRPEIVALDAQIQSQKARKKSAKHLRDQKVELTTADLKRSAGR